ncbi:MAG: winged helix-turn-helix transcriptional regulator [Gammaproteobacteria bacterium]|nr:winged helix-turn-helix transcriptional regulator [Gammaproteobacteria bacterium]
MEADGVVAVLSGLAQHTRLAIYRLLVRAGERGRAAGQIGTALALPPATLSFHLKELAATGLIRAEGFGRYVIYSADPGQMTALMLFLIREGCRRLDREQLDELRAALATLPAGRTRRGAAKKRRAKSRPA